MPHPRQAIEPEPVLEHPEALDVDLGLALPVLFVRGALALELHVGHGPAAADADLVDIDDNDGALARGVVDVRVLVVGLEQGVELGGVDPDDTAPAPQTHDFGRPLEGAEHQGDAAVFFEMRLGLDAGT